MTQAGCSSCGPNCESVFDRVVVSYLLRGGTQVMWELLPTFTDPPPYTFQLQAGQTRNPDANDWEDVGLPVTDMYSAVDGEQRVYGKSNFTHYRVKLTTSAGEYFSLPVGKEGTLSRRDWRLARDLLRQEMLRMRKGHIGQEGYLLKRRVTGENCPVCLDYMTRDVTDPSCETCWGTGKRCGYFYPVSCIWAEMDPRTYRTHRDGERGTVNDIVVRAVMVNTWFLAEDDVWVNKVTDDRYYVHKVQNTKEWRGVPLVAEVELRPAPTTDIIYALEIPQQIEGLI